MNNTDINTGLSSEEACRRASDGQSNGSFDIKTKSVPKIFFDNIFTLFNLINIILAALVISVGSWRNVLFMGVIISNTAIGIIQEMRSKRVIDKLSIISAPKAKLLRGGEEKILPVSDIVIGDIMLLSSGMQVCADAVIAEGECEADESLITGESEPVFKKRGSELLSGSFITSGYVKADVIRVGAQSASGKITSGSKYIKKRSSEMMKSIDKIIRTVSVCIVPFGAVLFYKAFYVAGQSLENGVTSTAAALIGMIPEGLVLLTSVALAVSSIRLARRRTLCQDLYCVESLARADVLCLDKTGTLTEGSMEISEIIPLDDGDKRFDIEAALGAFSAAFPEPNPTLKAIGERFGVENAPNPIKTIPFSSVRKWSAAQFDGFGTIILGAPVFVLGKNYDKFSEQCEELSKNGMRVLALASSSSALCESELPDRISARAIIALSDKIRVSARDTLEYFKSQGVALKVISGDDPVTVSNTAKRAGMDDADNYADLTNVPDEKLPELAEKYTVFGRVTPDQKFLLIKALKSLGHKTAMIGDGVNDVPALKEADCSVAMQSGSDAARAVSQIVLLNSDFASMPLVVAEGRRCINNIQRSAALFLVKTVFSFLLAAAFLFLPFAYPFKPIQMTLISAITIGIPSFLLALEPNTNIVRGSFISNVMRKAAPGGISAAVGVIMLTAAEAVFGFSPECTSAMATLLTAAAYFAVLWNVCRPFGENRRHAVMFAGLTVLFAAAAIVLNELFYMVPLSVTEWTALGILIFAVWIIQIILSVLARKFKIKK